MNKPNVANFFKHVQLVVTKHSPEILTGIGIAGMITTTVLAVRATPRALELIEQKKKDECIDKLAPMDVIKATWKCYIPSAITCVASTGCLIGASSVHLRRNAALATVYKLSETALTEYREKVVETIGEKKEQIIREKVKEEQLKKNPIEKNEVIVTGGGATKCLDVISGRYFESDIERIKKVVNELNRIMLTDITGYISLNDFYDELNLERISVGDDLGWNVTKGLIELDISAHLTPNDIPCVVVDFVTRPQYGYDKFL